MVDSNSFDNAQEVRDGILIEDGPFITGGSPEPTGLDLPKSTLYIHETSTGIEIWKKYGTGVNDWVKIFGAVFAASPPPTVLNHNGTMSDGQLVGYSNLANNPLVIGFRSKLARVTMVNSKDNTDFDLRFYRNSETPANLFDTWEIRNPTDGIATTDITGSPIFEVGDTLPIYYDDQGINASDMNLGLFMEAVPE